MSAVREKPEGGEGEERSKRTKLKPTLLLPVPVRSVDTLPVSARPKPATTNQQQGSDGAFFGALDEGDHAAVGKDGPGALQKGFFGKIGRTPQVRSFGGAPPQQVLSSIQPLGVRFSASPTAVGVCAPSPMACCSPMAVCEKSPAAAFLQTHAHLPRDIRRQLADWNLRMGKKENQGATAAPFGGQQETEQQGQQLRPQNTGFGFSGPVPMEWEPTTGTLIQTGQPQIVAPWSFPPTTQQVGAPTQNGAGFPAAPNTLSTAPSSVNSGQFTATAPPLGSLPVAPFANRQGDAPLGLRFQHP